MFMMESSFSGDNRKRCSKLQWHRLFRLYLPVAVGLDFEPPHSGLHDCTAREGVSTWNPNGQIKVKAKELSFFSVALHHSPPPRERDGDTYGKQY